MRIEAWPIHGPQNSKSIFQKFIQSMIKSGDDVKVNQETNGDVAVISFDKVIEKYTDEDNVDKIEMRFPYHKKVIQLIRCMKDKRGLPGMYALYDGERKKWTFLHSDVTAYYLTLIAVRYDFKFMDESLLDDYEEIKKEIKGHRRPTARLIAGEVVLDNAPESLQEYWDENLKKKTVLKQVDSLKNFGLSTKGINVEASTVIGQKIAHSNYHKLWIDSKSFSKYEVIKGLIELECFPLIMPVSGDIHMEEDVRNFWEWLNAFKSYNIDVLNDCAWGFDVKEPIYKKDLDKFTNERHWLVDNQKPHEFFENLYELHQMSKQFKLISQNTKIIFVRNRIPRALIKSKVKPKASLVALGGGHYATGTDNLKRMLENLPKKLYYSDYQPSSWDWHDHVIVKL